MYGAAALYEPPNNTKFLWTRKMPYIVIITCIVIENGHFIYACIHFVFSMAHV